MSGTRVGTAPVGAPHAAPAEVLAWRESAAGQGSLRALWQQLADLGWLERAAGRVVIQLGQGCRVPQALESARSLANFLREQRPAAAILVLDAAAHDGDWDGLDLHDPASDEPMGLAAVAATRGLRVPALWFEPSYVITVAGAHPDAALRVAGVLAAQADALRRLRNPYLPQILAYEAHRLAASDLSIACGTATWGDPASERWWAASASDVAVDQALAAAADVDPLELPVLRSLARHECMASAVLRGSLPRLTGYVGAAWVAHAAAAGWRLRISPHALAHDFLMARRTARKIPGYARRQLAARKARAA